jgi:TPP-dependent pyruvate/acetoin dehydrogenase alpha subunit
VRDRLIAFEKRVAEECEAGKIQGPVHLSGGNEDQLIEVFKRVKCGDWVFSTWRNHYHALLHGIPEDKVLAEIRAGRSMNLCFPERRFYSSAIVGGILPIATGVAAALKRQKLKRKVWCFVGDMASMTGAFHEATYYAVGHDLPIQFVIEDNGVSTNTPTRECWGYCEDGNADIERYQYSRTHPHVGTGKWITF